MNSVDLEKQNRVRWFFAALTMVSIVVAVAGLAYYPRYQAYQWQEELWITTDSPEEQGLVSNLLRAENSHADEFLTDYAGQMDNVVFVREHRVVLFFDTKTGQPYSTTQWSADNMSPNITARYINPRVVENIPEAVTIAATNEVNGATSLFFYTYKHTDYVRGLSAEELEDFNTNGYWNEYLSRHGDRISKKRKKWIPAEEDSWKRWKESVEAEFAAQTSG